MERNTIIRRYVYDYHWNWTDYTGRYYGDEGQEVKRGLSASFLSEFANFTVRIMEGIPKYIYKERSIMMTFVTVMLAILAANAIWTVGIYAIMMNKKVQLKMIDYYAKWAEWYVKKMEEKFEEGL